MDADVKGVTDMSKRLILFKGKWGTVEYAMNENGNCLAKKDLDKIRKKSPEQYHRLRGLFVQYAKVGEIKSISKFNSLSDVIFEFKRHPDRVACFFVPGQNRCLLTHIFKKKDSKKYVSEQIQKAERIREHHLELEGISSEQENR